MITFHVTGDRRWSEKTARLSREIDTVAIGPAFRELRYDIDRTLREVFSPSIGGGSKGVQYKHGYTGTYLAGIQHKIQRESYTVYETVGEGGPRLRAGSGPAKDKTALSRGVVEWAMSKLGVPLNEAFAIARSVALRGIGWPGGQSPIPAEYPGGERRFAFPEWIVTIKNKSDIEKAAQKIGQLTVSYLDK